MGQSWDRGSDVGLSANRVHSHAYKCFEVEGGGQVFIDNFSTPVESIVLSRAKSGYFTVGPR